MLGRCDAARGGGTCARWAQAMRSPEFAVSRPGFDRGFNHGNDGPSRRGASRNGSPSGHRRNWAGERRPHPWPQCSGAGPGPGVPGASARTPFKASTEVLLVECLELARVCRCSLERCFAAPARRRRDSCVPNHCRAQELPAIDPQRDACPQPVARTTASGPRDGAKGR